MESPVSNTILQSNQLFPHPNSLQILQSNQLFPHPNSLQILRETVKILMQNPTTFIAISILLISPVSAIHLSNLLVDQSIVKTTTKTLLLVLKSSGLPSIPFVQQSCQKLAEIAISSIASFPFYCTLLLISKAAVVYSVECTYSRKKFVSSKFYVILKTIWRRIVSTYILICALIVGCLALFMILLICVTRLLFVIGFSRDSIGCIVVIIGLVFMLFLAHTLIVCDLSMVISVWEDVSGTQALVRSRVLIRGQTRVGLTIFVGSTVGMAIVKGLFEHRVKSLSYGDGYSRVWERPVLVLVYSFVVLIDFMMSAVFFFSCKSYSLEAVECGM
ncbi:hypothetical protein L1987_38732 [Smallanthus sonchifolius]|uniref:Uncharacterized protein n=1 Tax=Smallanthus sonchifolius TaxID=185202 RepID=A0ACB9HK22_9ASTR|nr:hypothetical protein L1987_38732 [Smallanthus sonchifolius]